MGLEERQEVVPSLEAFWECSEENAIRCVRRRYSHAGDGGAPEDKLQVKACRCCYRHFLMQHDIPTENGS